MDNYEKQIDDLFARVSKIEKALPINNEYPRVQLCASSLNKKELLHLFYIMMDESILFFDQSNQTANRTFFHSFLENHFTYRGDRGLQARIYNVSRHFSEAKGFSYRDEHIRCLDKFIRILQQRKLNLKNK